MADKSISDLTQATQITNDDLFVLQQGSEAKKLKGETLLDFVTLNVISVSVTTLPAGSQATASYNKSTGALILGIPQGETGPTGPANVLSIGTVSSGDTAAATITGTAPEQVLNLVLPKGDKGNPGSPGSKGDTGDDGNGIASITLKSGTHAAGTSDVYTITMTDGTTFDFSVYNGADGQGAGDMLKSVYDPGNKAQDVFQYVDDAVANVDVSGKLDKTGDGSNVIAAFTQASSRSNIVSGEKLSVLFGKIKKWFADLGSLAFKSTVGKSDLASDVQTSLGKADTALQSAPVTSVNGETGDVTVAVPTIPSTTDLLKGDGSGGMKSAISGSDYVSSTGVTNRINDKINRTNNVNVANTSYTTYMARGEALFAEETTPTVNGCIAWQYG